LVVVVAAEAFVVSAEPCPMAADGVRSDAAAGRRHRGRFGRFARFATAVASPHGRRSVPRPHR